MIDSCACVCSSYRIDFRQAYSIFNVFVYFLIIFRCFCFISASVGFEVSLSSGQYLTIASEKFLMFHLKQQGPYVLYFLPHVNLRLLHQRPGLHSHALDLIGFLILLLGTWFAGLHLQVDSLCISLVCVHVFFHWQAYPTFS